MNVSVHPFASVIVSNTFLVPGALYVTLEYVEKLDALTVPEGLAFVPKFQL